MSMKNEQDEPHLYDEKKNLTSQLKKLQFITENVLLYQIITYNSRNQLTKLSTNRFKVQKQCCQ
jgi:hypothetical protein